MRALLKPNIENLKELINNFEIIFDDLAKQATGLASTLDFKNETLSKIKSAKEKFSQEVETFNQYDKMQRDIDTFFQNIGRRISAINEKIQIASKRLASMEYFIPERKALVKTERFDSFYLQKHQEQFDNFSKLLSEYDLAETNFELNELEALVKLAADREKISDKIITQKEISTLYFDDAKYLKIDNLRRD